MEILTLRDALRERARRRPVSEIAEEDLMGAFDATLPDLTLHEDPDDVYNYEIAKRHKELVSENEDYKRLSEQFLSAVRIIFQGIPTTELDSEDASRATIILATVRALWQGVVLHPLAGRRQSLESADGMYQIYRETTPIEQKYANTALILYFYYPETQ